jgi:hypothetical protein
MSDTSFIVLHTSLHTQTANTTTETNARACAHTHTLYQIVRKLLQTMILDVATLNLCVSDLANEEAKMTDFEVQVSPSLPPSTTPSLPPSLHTHMRQLSDTQLQPSYSHTHTRVR